MNEQLNFSEKNLITEIKKILYKHFYKTLFFSTLKMFQYGKTFVLLLSIQLIHELKYVQNMKNELTNIYTFLKIIANNEISLFGKKI